MTFITDCMRRRQYLSLGTAGIVLGATGCLGGGDPQYPPYPDSESTEFLGDGDTVTDKFELSGGGPMIVEVQHDGDGRFVAFAVNEDERFVQGGPTVQAVGPYRGSSIHNLDNGTYSLEIEASGEWTATVHDLPVYEDETGLSLPIEREGALGSAIGPIDFGSPGEKRFTIEFDSVEGVNWVDLLDREGETVATLFEGRNAFVAEEPGATNETDASDSTADESVSTSNDTDDINESLPETESTVESIDLSGVGYLSIESGGEWVVSFTETE